MALLKHVSTTVQRVFWGPKRLLFLPACGAENSRGEEQEKNPHGQQGRAGGSSAVLRFVSIVPRVLSRSCTKHGVDNTPGTAIRGSDQECILWHYPKHFSLRKAGDTDRSERSSKCLVPPPFDNHQHLSQQIRAPESRACWEQPTIAAAADKNSKEEKPEEEPKKENEQSSGSKSSEDDFARKIPDHHKPVHDKTLDDQRDGGKSEEKPAHDKSPDNSASDEQSGEDKPIDDKSTDNESVGGKPAEEEQIKGPASGEAAKDKPADEECLEEKTLENKPIEPPAIKIPGLTLTRPMPPTVPPPPLKQSEDESQGKRSLKRKVPTTSTYAATDTLRF